jgi:CRISPR-associated protein Cmr3
VLLPKKELINYLEGNEIDAGSIASMDDICCKELRTGIMLNREKKVTEEGCLYVAEFIRLKEDWCFSVWVEVPDDNEYKNIFNEYIREGDVIKLGGEGRVAVIEKVEKIAFEELKIDYEEKFKIYVVSPSFFNGGVLPVGKVIPNSTLVSALLGKPIYIGGYDIARNKEKPLRRFVAPGAVYFCKLSHDAKEEIDVPLRRFDDNVELRCAFVGRW